MSVTVTVLGAEILEVPRAAANQIVDLAGGLDPAVARADDDEREKPAASLGIGAVLPLFHLFHDVRAQRAAQRLRAFHTGKAAAEDDDSFLVQLGAGH